MVVVVLFVLVCLFLFLLVVKFNHELIIIHFLHFDRCYGIADFDVYTFKFSIMSILKPL